MANFDRVNGPIDMRVWKGRRFEEWTSIRDCRLENCVFVQYFSLSNSISFPFIG